MSNNVAELLAKLEKAAGDVSSVNPPTSHESGGAPEDLTTFSTGERFSENTKDDADRPTATAESNKVDPKDPNKAIGAPTTTAATGEDPEFEKGVADRPNDPNSTSHPANASVGEKYAGNKMLNSMSATMDMLNTIVKESSAALAVLTKTAASNGSVKVDSDDTPSNDPTAKTAQEKIASIADEQLRTYVQNVFEQTKSAELVEFFSQASNIGDLQALHKKATDMIMQSRVEGHKAATVLADHLDQIKEASAKQAAKTDKTRSSILQTLKTAMEDGDKDDKGGDKDKSEGSSGKSEASSEDTASEESEDSSSGSGEDDSAVTTPAAEGMGGGAAADPAADPLAAAMAGGGGGADPAAAMVGADPAAAMGGGGGDPLAGAMGGGDPLAGAAGEDMGAVGGDMGGAMGGDVMAVLEQLAAEAGVPVEELIAQLASQKVAEFLDSQSSKPATTQKVANALTTDQQALYGKLEKLVKAAVADVTNRGSRR